LDRARPPEGEGLATPSALCEAFKDMRGELKSF
jgi:hypothetical protein